MPDEKLSFEDFLVTVEDAYKGFASDMNGALLAGGYKIKIETRANGFLVSYSHPKTKRSALNFIFRKNKLQARIYADNCNKYPDFLNSLPASMVSAIEKAPVCKRLVDPLDCNSRCVTGFDFSINGTRYKKCRYSCFQFELGPESEPFVREFIELEKSERNKPGGGA